MLSMEIVILKFFYKICFDLFTKLRFLGSENRQRRNYFSFILQNILDIIYIFMIRLLNSLNNFIFVLNFV